jgi:hypothetical protein
LNAAMFYKNGPTTESTCDDSIQTICKMKRVYQQPFKVECDSGVVAISADKEFVLNNYDQDDWE